MECRCDTVSVILPELPRRTRRLIAVASAVALTAGAAGCSGATDAEAQTSPSPTSAPALPPATQLAARAAQSQDQYYAASYRFVPADGSPAGTARIERTRSGFRLDLTQPADATHVERTTVVVKNQSGTFHCRLTAAARACLAATERPPADLDPRIQLAFTDWLAKLADPAAALSVTVSDPPRDGTGTCYSVEGVTASLDPPVDPGLYCFDNVGRITVLRLAAGLLTSVQVGVAPPEVTLPAAVGGPVPSGAAPSPTPSATPSGAAATPSPKGIASPTPRHSAQRR